MGFAAVLSSFLIVLAILSLIYFAGSRRKRYDETPFASGHSVRPTTVKRHAGWLFYAALFFIVDVGFLLLVFSSAAGTWLIPFAYLALLVLAFVFMLLAARW